jgi:hypothetical protein
MRTRDGDVTFLTAKRLPPWRSAPGRALLFTVALAAWMTFVTVPGIIRDEWLYGRHFLAAVLTMPVFAIATWLFVLLAMRWAWDQFTTLRLVVRSNDLTIIRQELRRSSSLCIDRAQLLDAFAERGLFGTAGQEPLTLKVQWTPLPDAPPMTLAVLSDRPREHILWMADELRRALSLPLKDPELPRWASDLRANRNKVRLSSGVIVRRTPNTVRITAAPTSLRAVNGGRSVTGLWVFVVIAVVLGLPFGIGSLQRPGGIGRTEMWLGAGIAGAFVALLAVGIAATRRAANTCVRLILRRDRLRAIERIGWSLRRYRWRCGDLFAVQATSHGRCNVHCLQLMTNDGRDTILLRGRSRNDIQFLAQLFNDELDLPSRARRSLAVIGSANDPQVNVTAHSPLEYEGGGPLGIGRRPGVIRFAEASPQSISESLGLAGISLMCFFIVPACAILALTLVIARVTPAATVSEGLRLGTGTLVIGVAPLVAAWWSAGTRRSIQITPEQLRWRADRGRRWRERIWPIDDVAAIRVRHREIFAVSPFGSSVPLIRARTYRAGREIAREWEIALGLAPPPRGMNDRAGDVDYTPAHE